MEVANTVPVLISGAGPSGLVLALTLQKNGIPVRIIDKELGPRLGERGAGVSPRSLELHRILGTFKDVYDDGKPIPLKRDYDPLDGYKVIKTSAMVPIQESSIGIPYANPIFVGQNHHERILRAHLEQLGTKVEFGTELRSFTQSTELDSVEVELLHRTADGKEEISQETVSWLIGTDGAHSTVRKALKFDFIGETREGIEIIIGDFRISSGVREYWENWGDQQDKIAFTRSSSRDPDVLVFLIAGKIETERLLASPQAIIDEFYNISGRRDIVIEDVICYSRYRPNIRMVKELRANRVFIAGDAAHCHSPAGGQGLNSSIQDTFNLGWKLALVEKGYAPESLLNTYAEERLPVIAEMLDKTTELLNERTGATTHKPTHASIEKDMTQMGVTYRGSSIVLRESGEQDSSATVIGYNKDSEFAALPGDRAPEAPSLIDAADNKKLDLFTLLSPSRHSVFIFVEGHSTDSLDAISEVLRRQPEGTNYSVIINKKGATPSLGTGKFDRVLIDDEGHGYETYNVNAPCVIIVRPDGFIGARVGGSQGVEQYFKKIFKN